MCRKLNSCLPQYNSHIHIPNVSKYISCLSQKHKTHSTVPIHLHPILATTTPPKTFGSILPSPLSFYHNIIDFNSLSQTNTFIALIGLYSKSVIFKKHMQPKISSILLSYLSKPSMQYLICLCMILQCLHNSYNVNFKHSVQHFTPFKFWLPFCLSILTSQ